MWGGPGREELSPQSQHQHLSFPELYVGLGGAGGGELVWQQAPIRQLESASACPAICPRPPGSRPPSASSAAGLRAWPGGAGGPVCLLFIPISFSAPALWTSCQVHEKFAAQPRRGLSCGAMVGRKGGCVQCFLSTVCLFAQLGTFAPHSHPVHSCHYFSFLSCCNSEGPRQSGPTLLPFGYLGTTPPSPSCLKG